MITNDYYSLLYFIATTYNNTKNTIGILRDYELSAI